MEMQSGAVLKVVKSGLQKKGMRYVSWLRLEQVQYEQLINQYRQGLTGKSLWTG